MYYPIRSTYEVLALANRLSRCATLNVDGCICYGSPKSGVHIQSKNHSDFVTWDSFCHLWLRNIKCDEFFNTKPFLYRKKEVIHLTREKILDEFFTQQPVVHCESIEDAIDFLAAARERGYPGPNSGCRVENPYWHAESAYRFDGSWIVQDLVDTYANVLGRTVYEWPPCSSMEVNSAEALKLF